MLKICCRISTIKINRVSFQVILPEVSSKHRKRFDYVYLQQLTSGIIQACNTLEMLFVVKVTMTKWNSIYCTSYELQTRLLSWHALDHCWFEDASSSLCLFLLPLFTLELPVNSAKNSSSTSDSELTVTIGGGSDQGDISRRNKFPNAFALLPVGLNSLLFLSCAGRSVWHHLLFQTLMWKVG